MRNTFSWRHAITIGVLVCLMSIVAGAVLAQEEPDLPEPEVPVIDLSASAEETPVEPVEPEVNQPEVIVIEPAVVEQTSGLSPDNGSVLPETETLLFDWADQTGNGQVGYEFEIYEYPFVVPTDPASELVNYQFFNDPLTSTTIFVSSTPLTDTNAARLNAPSYLEIQNNGDGLFKNGLRYIWGVRAFDDDGPGPWQAATFTVDEARISPTLTDTVNITTPIITWPELAGVEWYRVIVYSDNGRFIGSDDYYPVNDTAFAEPFNEGICEDGQCKAKPRSEIQFGLSGGFDNVGPFTVYVQALDASFAPIDPTGFGFTDVSGGFFALTQFTLAAPNQDGTGLSRSARVNVDGNPAGLPGFTVDRPEVTVDEIDGELLGFTRTVAPDYYRLYIIPQNQSTFVFGDNAVPRGSGFVIDEWFQVINDGFNEQCFDRSPFEVDAMPTEDCTLTAFDGSQNLLYNGEYALWIQGYVSEIDGYTPWQQQQNFTIAAPAPSADAIVVAETYEEVGGPSVNPFSMTDTWVPCDDSGAGCETNRPAVHIVPDNLNGGEWMNILAYDNVDRRTVINWWGRIGGPNANSATSNIFVCGEGFGAGAFMTTTCFFQPGAYNGADNGFATGFQGFVNGRNYTWYIAQFGPGGISTGGVGNLGYTDPAAQPGADFSIQGAPAVENLMVDLDGSDVLTTTLPALTESVVQGAPVFTWDNVPEASFYNLLITNASGATIAGTGSWLAAGEICENVVDGKCVYTPDISVGLINNGTYNVNLIYWNGGVSQAATTSFEIANGPAVAVESMTETMIVYDNESLTSTTRPTFSWQHAQGNTWYQLNISQNGATIYPNAADNGWRRAVDLCDYEGIQQEFGGFFGLTNTYSLQCDFRFTDGSLFTGGDYSWFVQSYSPNGTVAQSTPQDFSIASTGTGVPNPLWPIATTHTLTWTNTPTFWFEAADNASWYQIFAHIPGQPATVVDWFYLPSRNIAPLVTTMPMTGTSITSGQFWDDSGVGIYCFLAEDTGFGPVTIFNGPDNDPVVVEDGTVVCPAPYSSSSTDTTFSFYNTPFLVNGDYDWYIQPYGPTGFNTTDSLSGSGWFGPYEFTVDIPETDPVNMSNAFPNDFTIVETLNGANWQGVPFAQFYYVEIKDTATGRVVFSDFAFGSGTDFEPFRGISTAAFNGSPYGVYEYTVASWGQGNSFNFFPQGPTGPLDLENTFTFPVDDPDTFQNEGPQNFTKL